MTGGAELVGGANFARTMAEFGNDIQALTEAHTAAGAEVARLAASRARRQTGRLAASFGPRVTDAGVEIASPVRYAGVQEFGWAAHHITPSLALTSSLDDAGPTVERIYGDAVDTALGKVRGK
jgi:hypothetical protein